MRRFRLEATIPDGWSNKVRHRGEGKSQEQFVGVHRITIGYVEQASREPRLTTSTTN